MIIFCYYHVSYSLLNVLYVCCPIVGIITCIFYFRAPFIKYITTTDWVVYPFSTPVSKQISFVHMNGFQTRAAVVYLPFSDPLLQNRMCSERMSLIHHRLRIKLIVSRGTFGKIVCCFTWSNVKNMCEPTRG